jgi:hypothetical protein
MEMKLPEVSFGGKVELDVKVSSRGCCHSLNWTDLLIGRVDLHPPGTASSDRFGQAHKGCAIIGGHFVPRILRTLAKGLMESFSKEVQANVDRRICD